MMPKLKESTDEEKKLREAEKEARDAKATSEKVADDKAKNVLINLKLQFADAVMERGRVEQRFDECSAFCNALATEIEKRNAR